MTRRAIVPDHQRGAALVLFLGVSAALAVLSIALVMAVANATHNTSREQHKTKAFDVAEAALDVTMQRLAKHWPSSQEIVDAYGSQQTWTDNGSSGSDFANQFLVGTTPSSPSNAANLVNVLVFDNLESSTVLEPGWELAAPRYDAGVSGVGDDMMLVDAQATVNGQSARIRATVRAVPYRLGLARTMAVWADGALMGGGGSSFNITTEVLPFNSVQAGIHAASYVNNGQLYDPGRIKADPAGSDTLPPITQDTVDGLVELAKDTGRYFSGSSAEGDMKVALQDEVPGPFEGLCVLDYRGTPGYSVTLDQGYYNCDVDNSGHATVFIPGEPGALLILGADLTFSGHSEYYGLIYVEDGNVGTAMSGNPVIHGMLVCVNNEDPSKGQIDFSGNVSVKFNANAARDLDKGFLTGVRIGGNGWRELQPTPASP
jgi:hypothetical protein